MTAAPGGLPSAATHPADPLSGRDLFSLLLILAIAGAVRCAFFIGIVGTLPQDDGIYANEMLAIAAGEYPQARVGAILDAGMPVNPALIFSLRVPYISLGVLAIRVMGRSEIAMVLPALLASLVAVAGAWLLGRRLGGARLAALAGLLLATTPIDLLYATRVTPDTLLGALAVASFLAGEIGIAGRRSGFLLAGLLAGISHSIRPLGIVIVPYVVLLALAQPRATRRHALLWTIAGIASGHAPAFGAYLATSGRALLDLAALKSAYADNYATVTAAPTTILPGVRALYFDSSRLFYLRRLIDAARALAPLAALFLFGAWAGRGQAMIRRAALFTVAGVVLLESAPVGGRIADDHLLLWAAPKHLRNLLVVLPVAALVAASGVHRIFVWRRGLAGLLLLGLVGFSVREVAVERAAWRGAVTSIREAMTEGLAVPFATIHADHLAAGFFKVWRPSAMGRFRLLEDIPPEAGSAPELALRGGPRGHNMSADYIEDVTPAAWNAATPDRPPAGWRFVRRWDDGLELYRRSPEDSVPASGALLAEIVPAPDLARRPGGFDAIRIERAGESLVASFRFAPRSEAENALNVTMLCLFDLDRDPVTGSIAPDFGGDLHIRIRRDWDGWSAYADRIEPDGRAMNRRIGIRQDGARFRVFFDDARARRGETAALTAMSFVETRSGTTGGIAWQEIGRREVTW